MKKFSIFVPQTQSLSEVTFPNNEIEREVDISRHVKNHIPKGIIKRNLMTAVSNAYYLMREDEIEVEVSLHPTDNEKETHKMNLFIFTEKDMANLIEQLIPDSTVKILEIE